LDPDALLLSSLERFPGVSPPGGGTRIPDSATNKRLPAMLAPIFFLLGVSAGPRTTIASSSESSISIGFSREPEGGRWWDWSASCFIVTGVSVAGVGVGGADTWLAGSGMGLRAFWVGTLWLGTFWQGTSTTGVLNQPEKLQTLVCVTNAASCAT